ncbi:MAG: hypothetical protein KQI35_18085 [Bacteroidetes bacterium]|nr:hypothetical protein [Bacteroidota bacterium]
MKTLKIITLAGYGLVTLLGFVFTYLYLSRSEFMPYHAVAVGLNWEEVEPGFQTLILALMRVSGGGWLATSLGMSLLLIRLFKDDKFWILIYIGIIGLSACIPTLLATLMVRHNSPANPPWFAAAGAIALIIISLLAGIIRANRLKSKEKGRVITG